MSAKSILTTLAAKSGIDLAKIKVHDERVYQRILRDRNLGMGESYVEGWWDCEHLDELFCQIKTSRSDKQLELSFWMWLRVIFLYLLSFFINFQSRDRSLVVGVEHYDLGDTLYSRMLDRKMIYSCGYWKTDVDRSTSDEQQSVHSWKETDDLNQAQINKLDLICQKLKLEPGMKVLDIGCGWGGFAEYAATNYQVEVLGITISKEQLKYAIEHNIVESDREENGSTKFEFMDYRNLLDHEKYEKYFDAVVSIGMFEHVGSQNYRTFMKVSSYVMKDNGLTLLHTISQRKTRLENDPFFDKHIFPNSLLPTIQQISQAAEEILVMEDLHNFGSDYDKTLMVWHHNFNQYFDQINLERSKNGQLEFDQKFKRMWNYYLLSSAGFFRARDLQLYQIVFSKGLKGGYTGIR